MEYQVKDIVKLTGVTARTLHHYHKIGLLTPSRVTESGYRIYGMDELERLQQILFYRELDFTLVEIKRLLDQQTDYLFSLRHQRELLIAHKKRLDRLIQTIDETIMTKERGDNMVAQALFTGFSDQEWQKILNRPPQELFPAEASESSQESELMMKRIGGEIAEYMVELFRNSSDAELSEELRSLRNEMAASTAVLMAGLLSGRNQNVISDSYRSILLERLRIVAPYYLEKKGTSLSRE